ncbi:MAG: translation initiation factor IF-2 associated domain-containing protein, partial [Comamonas sp.]|nr:translation initiation factor IF-2 associated domain-containing protein [Comamonas sp.]
MSLNTVAEFASELKKSPETLLEQLNAAGVAKSSGTDALTETDKQMLLSHLKASHGSEGDGKKKITLTKKSTSEIKQADATGRARTIQVEVRKKRTFIKRDDAPEVVAEAAARSAQAAQASQELVRREEEARKQAEMISQEEVELVRERQEREEREDRARKEREAEERAAAYAAAEAAK